LQYRDLTALSLCAVMLVLLSACGGGAPSLSQGSRDSVQAVPATEISMEPPPGEQLEAGEYGLNRQGQQLVPTFTLRELRCQSPGSIEVATEDGDYYIHLRALPQWTCDQAIEQARKTAQNNPRGMKVGLIFRDGPSGVGQVNLIFGNGGSVLYAARGLYRSES
jgi:hypothetical protein